MTAHKEVTTMHNGICSCCNFAYTQVMRYRFVYDFLDDAASVPVRSAASHIVLVIFLTSLNEIILLNLLSFVVSHRAKNGKYCSLLLCFALYKILRFTSLFFLLCCTFGVLFIVTLKKSDFWNIGTKYYFLCKMFAQCIVKDLGKHILEVHLNNAQVKCKSFK